VTFRGVSLAAMTEGEYQYFPPEDFRIRIFYF